MKRLFILAIGMAVGTALLTGCATGPKSAVKPAPAPELKPTAATAGDLQFTDEIYATVTDDQSFAMDGKNYKVTDIPKVLKQKKVSQYITIVVDAQSKMKKETLAQLLQVLVDNDYLVVVGEESKFADTAVPKKS